jgi:catechol 2,3-dioxygenase-like lactoylglutathione lyase family enzyme
MKARISLITLGVDDLARSRRHRVRARRVARAQREQPGGRGRGDGAREARGREHREAGPATLWGGYAGYFQDPDGHLWEVAWNPALVVPEP